MAARLAVVVLGLAASLGLAACASQTPAAAPDAPAASAAGAAALGSLHVVKAASNSSPHRSSATVGQAGHSAGGLGASALSSLVLQASELPGFTGDGSGGPQPLSSPGDAQSARCLGVADPDQYALASFSSDEFQQGTLSIDSNVTSYRSTKAVAIDRAMIADPTRLALCLKRLLVSTLPSSGMPSGTKVNVVGFEPRPRGVPSNVLGLVQEVVSTKVDGRATVLFIQTVLAVGRQVDGSLTFTDVGSQPPAALVLSLTTAFAHRVAGK